ncbi:hypothetical protein RD792_004107, partial [Penstemon davidsonii]
MEAIIHAHSNSPLYSTWTPPYNPITPTQKITKPIKPKTSLKPLALSNSLKTSFKSNNHEYQKEENFNLPIAVRHSGTVSRYFWDGKQLGLVSVNGVNSFSWWDFSLNFEQGVRNFFLPREVSENYIQYVKWKFLHRVSSSALQVLATQVLILAMFRAIGIGYSRSLPSAAALNWVLKDGLGRLSRCIYTATLASAFDTNLKRVRFSTSVLFSMSIGVELLTPIFPKYFLLLATIANIAKQISLSCYLATGSAVHRSFAIADNLGELSAKAQIQTVCFDNIGLLLAATLNILFRNNQRLLAALPFVLYPIFSVMDLLGIYQGLKHVHLQTLTKDRLESIINTWIQLGYVPSPAEMSKKEGIDFFWSNKGKELLSIRIGCLNPKKRMPKLSMLTLRSLKDEDLYFICMESFNEESRISDHNILLSLREGAGTSDIIMGLLHACYVRKGILRDMTHWENALEDLDSSDSVLRE